MTNLIIALKRPERSDIILPAGRYPVEVKAMSLKEGSNGNGDYQYVLVNYAIANGGAKYHNTWLSSFHIVEHSNDQTVEIALEQLSRLAVACGVELSDDEQDIDLAALVGKTLEIRVDAPEEGQTRNRVSGWYANGVMEAAA